MPAINFPSSPTNGQIFGSFTYDSALPGWRSTPDLASGLPAGTIVQWPSNTAPANWLICDGSAISRTEYASLFSAIGVTYGSGNGTTTFNLPNLKGRIPVGRDSSQTEFDTLGETGGAKTHTLTESEMPSHTHIQNSHNHTQNSHNHTQNAHSHLSVINLSLVNVRSAGSNTYNSDGAADKSGGIASTTATNNPTTATNQATTATNQNTGGGLAHNNLQPYIVLNYIIKASVGITSGDSELATRVGSTESVNTTQNSRLTSLETVTTPVVATSRYTAGGILTTSYVTYVTVTITSTNRPVVVNMSANYSNANSNANRTVDFRVQMGGVTLNEELTGNFSPWVSGIQTPLNISDTFLVTPAAGSRTFTLQARASNGSSVGLFRASLVVTQL